MKVIFLPNNTASLISSRIPFLRQRGIEAVGFNFAPKVFQNKSEVINYPESYSILSLLIGRIKFFFCFVYHLMTADAVHWVYGSGSRSAGFILCFVALVKRKKFIEYCGSDVRSLEKLCEDVSNYDISQFTEKMKNDLGTSVSSEKTQRKFQSRGFLPMPNSPELVDYLIPQVHTGFFQISRAVDLSRIPYVGVSSNVQAPLVVHMPSNPEIKGTQKFVEAAARLEKSGKIRFQMITGVPHEEALKILKAADVVVDQLLIGEYGVLSIEAMALGKPVICFLRPKLWETYNQIHPGFPIQNASLETIGEVLERLAANADLRVQLGKEGRKYAEAYHDANREISRLIEIYEGQRQPTPLS